MGATWPLKCISLSVPETSAFRRLSSQGSVVVVVGGDDGRARIKPAKGLVQQYTTLPVCLFLGWPRS